PSIVDRELIESLAMLARPPDPWTPGEDQFWDHPHIAERMLEAHLDPTIAAASAPPAVIDATVSWICEHLDLGGGASLIDLGCGPGLYARRFSERGLEVTGVDLSSNSIAYAARHDPLTTYRCENYLELDDVDRYRVATLIFGDYCVLDDDRRRILLGNVHRALQPQGWFVFDVTTEVHHRRRDGTGWSAHPSGGFWRPGPHLVLTSSFHYDDESLALDQYVVVEPGTAPAVYRNWFRYFDAESLTVELEAGGFAVSGLYSDLAGSPPAPGSEWIGVVARRS
ncbi:MAG: class I SAM-dependent methyltransferase, partial [Acidimicrobiia bacterium]|nr:class I SAM-dependent methyltransferase [Acidimicrobiia bacterium]